MSHYVYRLLNRHRQLDDALRIEQKSRWPDFARLQRLKKLKLAVKDRLNALVTPQRPAPAMS